MTDPAFEGVGQTPGLTIWRIEDFEVKSIPTSEYGNFYNGDSYIVLNTTGSQIGKLRWDIHFWLGEDTSQDEMGSAAIKAVELDDSLGGGPVQHREVQGYESALFLSYFKKGLRYLKGGVKSGFHHVEDVDVKRLLRVKGRRNVRLHEVPADTNSINKGDCFILDSGPVVYVYVGDQSGRMERIKALQAANAIRDDLHCGRSEVRFIDANSSVSEVQEFFDELGGGGSPENVADPTPDEDDKKFEENFETRIALYKIWDDSGELQVEEIAEKPLKQEYLNTNDCFLLDGGVNGLFVWIGKDSSRNERTEAMNLASKYIEKQGYPKWLQVKRIVERAEPPLFKSYFSVWNEPEDLDSLGKHFDLEQGDLSSEELKRKCMLYAKSAGNASGFMPDDGSGEVEIWKAENFDLLPVPESQKGIFFGGDSYIIKYTYNKNGERYVLYFWQGLQSSQDERATVAMRTVQMDNELCGKAVQVRVVHGQEPEHFLRVFKGRMVILMGGRASGFNNIHDHDSYDVDGTRLFQVRGTNEYNVRAEQVEETSSSLNSNDVFILETPTSTFLWIGQGSSKEELDMARQLMETVSPGRDVTEMNEGDECDEFWSSLGGKGDYPKCRAFPSRPLLNPRLFKVSNGSGRIRVEEICNFTQEDLSEDDVMILDTGDAIYIWIGKGADEQEKAESMIVTQKYINSDPTERTLDNTVILTVKQGNEPENFKILFGDWKDQLWQDLSKLTVG